jgi:multisubunit Na+/H+ antiporter MnhG subunit
MMPPAEMVPATAVMTTATMPTAVMAATVTTPMPAAMTAAASRNRKIRHAQRRCEDNGGNSQRNP